MDKCSSELQQMARSTPLPNEYQASLIGVVYKRERASCWWRGQTPFASLGLDEELAFKLAWERRIMERAREQLGSPWSGKKG